MTSIHVQRTFEGASQQQKDAEARQIAADLARFEAAGGQIQRLGTSPIDRSTITRRQVVEGGHEVRTKQKEKRV